GGVRGGPGPPVAVPLPVLAPLAGHRGHQLVAAHADVAVDPPHRQGQAMLAERAGPGEGGSGVCVDQGAVDVQARDRGRHRRPAQARAVAWACSSWTPSANSSTSLALKAGRSSGLRLVTRPRSVWTSSSTQVPPAFSTSVRMLGHEVSVRPLTTPASTRVQAPWQIEATGLPASKNERTNWTASLSLRRKSGLATPPGSTSPSYSSALASATALSTGKVSPLSRWLKPWISPGSSDTRCAVAPACSTALRGSVYSICSTPSVARTAMVLPCSPPATCSSCSRTTMLHPLSIDVLEEPQTGQNWFWSLKISETLASSNTARMASATIPATDSTTILSSCRSGGRGRVLVTTTSAMGAFLSRSMA